jgi:eukaryotic-like serine/threonine-protein kinase
MQPIALQAGTRLGAFKLVRLLGLGGMGQVWLATDPEHALVVVKTPRDEYASDPVVRTLLEDEGDLLSRLQDPRWPRFIAHEREGERAFLVMEYIEGDSLQHWLARAEAVDAHIPRGVLSAVMGDAALGLHALHELRHKVGAPLEAVHRDVSPHNIVISTSGIVRMIDLGVAKSRVRKSENTEEGLFRGRLRYSSPEQAQGAPANRRMDVWALGATLFAALTRRLPYADLPDFQILALMNEPYPLLVGTEDLQGPGDEALFAVVREATSRNQQDRFPTTLAFAEALHAAHPPSSQARVALFSEELCGEAHGRVSADLRFIGAVVNSDD